MTKKHPQLRAGFSGLTWHAFEFNSDGPLMKGLTDAAPCTFDSETWPLNVNDVVVKSTLEGFWVGGKDSEKLVMIW